MKKMNAMLAGTLLVISTSVIAETPDAKTTREIFDDWQLNCAEKGDVKQCSVSQELRTDKGQVAAVINLSSVDGKTVLEFGLPLMMDLTSAVSVSVDGDSAKIYPYNACNGRACFVIRKDDNDLVDAFKRGSQAQVISKAFSGQNVEMLVSLKGFSRALAELQKR